MDKMDKKASRTTMPFNGGLSPVTDKSRQAPQFGGGPFDKPRAEFDKNVGGDHKFIGPDPDGLSHAVGGVFRGEWDHADLTVPYATEVVVVDGEGEEHVYNDRNYEVVLLEWKTRSYKYMFRRMRKSKKAQVGESDSLVPLVSSIMPACFKLISESARHGTTEIGSCFAVSKNTFLTCAHVISKENEDPSDVSLFITENDKRYRAVPIDVDYEMDLAIVKCDTVRHSPLSLKSIEKTPVGSDILCVGSPHGYDNNVSRGIVSSKGRVVPGEDVSYFFIDLTVFPGNSGGPVIDISDGKIIGIAAIIVDSVGNYGLNAAIPVDYAMKRFELR